MHKNQTFTLVPGANAIKTIFGFYGCETFQIAFEGLHSVVGLSAKGVTHEGLPRTIHTKTRHCFWVNVAFAFAVCLGVSAP